MLHRHILFTSAALLTLLSFATLPALAAPALQSTPTVVAVSPPTGASSVGMDVNVTALFSTAIDPKTINASTFELRNPSDALVSAAVTFSPPMRTARLHPTAALTPSTTFTATLKGGSVDPRVRDINGNPMATDFVWTFTTAAPSPPPDEGQGGPILVIADAAYAANPFGRYLAEILRAEGLNAFEVTDISRVFAATLAAYDVAILSEMSLSSAQVDMFRDWVNAGGHLIASRPDKQLAALFGLADAGGVTSEGYLLIDTSTNIGRGLVAETIQFHGTADHYNLAGASAIATLYSNATTPTAYPAVAWYHYGSGDVVMFVYDLVRSVIYTRQGNPAWAGQERDGVSAIRALDMFVGLDGEPNWIDSSKVHIAQADEQMRLLTHAIEQLNTSHRPLPRLWYFPDRSKGVLIMTGDSEGCDTACVDIPMQHVHSYGGHYTAYLLGTQPTAADVDQWRADGHDVAPHYDDTGEANNPTWANMWAVYDNMTQAHINAYSIAPRTVRNHWILWVGWSEQAEIEEAHGIQLDANYYHYGSWAGGPGQFTGSGLPMRFSDEYGRVLDIFQANTQLPDEWWHNGIDDAFQAIIDRSIDQGAYAFVTTNFHPPSYPSYQADADNMMAYANSRGVPIWSGEMLLDFLQARNSVRIASIAWSAATLTFDSAVPIGGEHLTLMIPSQAAGANLQSIQVNGVPVTFATDTVAGYEYAFFAAQTGAYQAVYAPDTTPPVISDVTASPSTGDAATITWNTNEASDSRVDYGTAPEALTLNATHAALVTAHSLNLTGLTPNTTYYYRVTSADAADNSATSPATGNPAASFTTPSASLVDTVVADFGAGSPDANTYIAQMGNGELILAPALGAEFSGAALPPSWSTINHFSPNLVSVSNGTLTVDGATALVDATYGPGRSLEFVATFSGAAYQHVGFFAPGITAPWAIFSTNMGGSALYARTNPGTEINYVIPGNWLNAPHRYRIEWNTSNVAYYIDGALVATHAASIAATMSPMVVDYNDTVSGVVTVDWLHTSPYAASGTFLSRIFDAGNPSSWNTATWTADMPAGANLAMSVRTGSTAVPDASWTDWSLLSGSGAPVGMNSRYIQYRAEMVTTDPTQTPVLQDVTLSYNEGPDVTPPTIMDRSPAPGTNDIPRAADVVVRFSEPMNSSTLNATTFRLRASGAPSDVSAIVSYSGLTGTLHPSSLLAAGVAYRVTVAGSVEDVNGNAMGSDDTWVFTTTLMSFQDTTVADFAAGTPDANLYIAQAADGEILLAPTVVEEFPGTTLPTGWSSASDYAGGTALVNSGALVVDGAHAWANNLHGPGRSLEFVATFSGAQYQHVGFFNAGYSHWAILSTGASGGALYARTNPGTEINDLIPGNWLNAPHCYRIEWSASSVVYYVDGAPVLTHTATIADDMRVVVYDYNAAGSGTVSVDWLRMSPYPAPGTFTPSLEDAFDGSAIDLAKWTQHSYGGGVTVGGGEVTVGAAGIQSLAAFAPQRILEGRVRFTAQAYEHFGFATDLDGTNSTQWALFSTYNTGDGVYARTWLNASAESGFVTLLPSVTLDEYHIFKIVWQSTAIEYYVDGQLLVTHSRVLTGPLTAWVAGLGTFSADWMRAGAYPTSSVFVSRVFDASGTAAWHDLTWSGSRPGGASVAFQTRTGNTSTPDGSWSAWSAVNSPIASPPARYLQYRATLNTTDGLASPVVESVTVTYSDQPTAVKLVNFQVIHQPWNWWRWLLARLGR